MDKHFVKILSDCILPNDMDSVVTALASKYSFNKQLNRRHVKI